MPRASAFLFQVRPWGIEAVTLPPAAVPLRPADPDAVAGGAHSLRVCVYACVCVFVFVFVCLCLCVCVQLFFVLGNAEMERVSDWCFFRWITGKQARASQTPRGNQMMQSKSPPPLLPCSRLPSSFLPPPARFASPKSNTAHRLRSRCSICGGRLTRTCCGLVDGTSCATRARGSTACSRAQRCQAQCTPSSGVCAVLWLWLLCVVMYLCSVGFKPMRACCMFVCM